MPAQYADAAKNLMLDQLDAQGLFISLHTADPGLTGASEASGGSPAYARQSVTFSAAAGGALDSSNTPVLDVPAGTYTHFGVWSLATAGTFYVGGALSASETFAAQGTYTFDDVDLDLNNDPA